MNATELLRTSAAELPAEAKSGPWVPMGRKGTLAGILVDPYKTRGPGSILADCAGSDGQDTPGDMAITGHICLMADPRVATALADLLGRFHELRRYDINRGREPQMSDLDGQVGYLEHLLMAKVR